MEGARRDLGTAGCSAREHRPRYGATGQVGGAVLEELIRRGVQARAMVRTENRPDGLAARGVEAVVGDLERPETLPGALSGIGCVFLMSRDDPNQPEMEGALIEAPGRTGVGRIVKLSASGAPPTVRSR